MTSRLLLVLLGLLSSACASAQVYKSVDADGKIVYSDRPSDKGAQVSVIKAAISVPLYTQVEQPAPERKVALATVSVLAADISPDERSRMAALGLNARGEVCARIVADNAKAARATSSSFSAAPK